jgi:hypothetical protein
MVIWSELGRWIMASLLSTREGRLGVGRRALVLEGKGLGGEKKLAAW